MKNYNEEYFYVTSTDPDLYPVLDYVQGGDIIELLDEESLDLEETRIMSFSPPIPKEPELADYHHLTKNAPIISERLKVLLESLNLKEVEFVPVIVQDEEGEEHDGYYIFHVLNHIECMDKEKSDWIPNKYKPGKAASVEKLVLDNDALNKIPLEERLVFALWEKSTEVLFHRSIVDKILEIAPTGLTVYRLSRWDPQSPFIEEYVEDLMRRKR